MSDTKLFVNKQKGGLFTVLDKEFATGSIFYVQATDGTDGAGYGQNPDSPVATLDYAIGLCTASKGDIIFLLPGHAENLASATGAVLDVAGVKVIGLGRGSLQPKLSLITAAGATLSITAANCEVHNVWLYSNFTNGVTAGVTLAATADGGLLSELKFTEAANTKEFLLGVSIAALCHDVVIENCHYIGTAGGTTSSIVSAIGASNNLIMENNYLHGDCSAAAVKLDAAASTDLQILNNRVINIDTGAGLGIAMHNSCTGMVTENYVTNLKDNVVGLSGTGVSYHENFGSNAVGASGIILPAVDS